MELLMKKFIFSILRLLTVCVWITGCGSKTPIDSNFVDPVDIAGYSQFNSCCGHIYPDNVTVSRKHYLYPESQYLGTHDKLKVYAPCTGTVKFDVIAGGHGGCADGSSRGTEISISCKNDRKATVVLFHQNPASGVTDGSEVKTGQLLSYAYLDCTTNTAEQNQQTNFDIAFLASGDKGADSVFSYMVPGVRSTWEARGVRASQINVSDGATCDFSDSTGAAALCVKESIYF